MKRTADLLAAAAGLVLLAPLLAAVAMLVLVSMGWPVFFVQQRPGLRGRPFRLVKFRTMRRGPGTDDERKTALGRFLRRFSIDELPELWNVLKGEMSLVGPRPLLMQYLELYTPEQARRHDVRPGITGWAQVNGRNALTWEQKFAHDTWYVDHRSARLDLRILGRTLRRVVGRQGVDFAGGDGMPFFRGTGKGE
ncbi:sugar transferase [candidate division WOR-3 bacterium]|nr:sugar transferase [candidate division WOR-3 bacterium]